MLRDKDENSSQEKETSESEENKKIKQEKTLGKQKAWEKSVPSHKVIEQDNTFENMLLVEQPSLIFCKGTLASLVKKESLKEDCLDKKGSKLF